MADWRRISFEERKGVCAKEYSVKSRNNLAAAWCTGSRTWRKVEDDRISDKKLLVARVTKDVGKYMDSCDMCQRVKNRIEVLIGKLKLSKVLEKL